MNLLFLYSAVFLLEGIDNITEIHDIKKKFSWITQVTNFKKITSSFYGWDSTVYQLVYFNIIEIEI